MSGSEAETIQQRIEAVRHDLENDIHDITDKVREFGVWRSYVKSYPWVCLSTAAILGYLIVHRKQKLPASGIRHPTTETPLDGQPVFSNQQPYQHASQVAVNYIGAAILRGVSTYIGNRVEDILENYHKNTRDETS